MELLRNAAKIFTPGSPLFMAGGLVVGVLLLFGPRRAARWGRAWLAVLACFYLLLSLQGTSDLLVYGLSHGFHSMRTADDARGARIVVVLSNGVQASQTADEELVVADVQTRFVAIEAARIYKLLGDPQVLASGGGTDPAVKTSEGEVLAEALEHLGVPRGRIDIEGHSRNTYEQAVNSSEWLRAHGQTEFVLVTSPEHMRRAAGAFVARGLRPIASTSRIQYGGSPFWQPTGFALEGSRSALYEYLAGAFYWWRGWM